MSANSLAHRASVLAIGTELTTGQITNRNAAWISEKLVRLGADIALHETVADDRKTILSALDRCWEMSRLVFVCGGLGPTTDDFTRDVVAEWLGKPLEFYEPSWIKIEQRLAKFGIPVSPSNRQQAFYPQGAQVLKNAQGTADGFSCVISRGGETGRMWVLPGPPREIEAIWDETGVDAQISGELPATIEPSQLFTWDCIGKSEAELGDLTEEAISGSGFQTGYRFHRPYVEVKVWVPKSKLDQRHPWFEKLETKIGKWVVNRNGDDLAEQLLKLCDRADEIDILDSCSGGFLMERIGPILRRRAELSSRIALAQEWQSPQSPTEWVSNALSQADSEALTLAIAGISASGEWAVGLREYDRVYQETLVSPWKEVGIMERGKPFAVEMALKKWRDWLVQSTS